MLAIHNGGASFRARIDHGYVKMGWVRPNGRPFHEMWIGLDDAPQFILRQVLAWLDNPTRNVHITL